MRAMFALLTAIFVLPIGARADNIYHYNYTGAVQTFTVPAGITSISVDAYGASGTGTGGLGGRVQSTISVSEGQRLNIYVGGVGVDGPNAVGGWNGGGGRHSNYGSSISAGGGATDIRLENTSLNDRILVAGGGGGGYGSERGGHGGGLVGGKGEGYGATGGSQSAGGRPHQGGNDSYRFGTFGIGAHGASNNYASGSGGGGWYGGGSGDPFLLNGISWASGAETGGGGSSYTDSELSSSVVHTQGVKNGHGELIITVNAPVITVTSGTDTVGQGSTWVDAGATADGGETVTASGTVDTSVVGTYTITYTATDAAGNAGTVTRTVTVGDGNFVPVGIDASIEMPKGVVASGSLVATDVDQNSVLTFALDEPVAGLTLATNGDYTFDGNNQAYGDLWEGDSREVVANWTVTDQHGASDSRKLTITVQGIGVDTAAPVITVAVAANSLADLVGGSLTDDGNGNYTLVSNIDLTEDLIIESNETLFINTNIQLNISAKVYNKGIVFLTGNTNNQTTVNNYGVFVNEGLIKSSNQYEYFYNKSGGEFYNLNLNQGDAITQELYHFSSRSGSVIFDVKSTFNFGRLNTISGDYTGDYTGEIPYEVALLDGNTVEQGATWADPGATADTGETVTASGTVDTSVAGTYTITYAVTDAAGNVATPVTRTVTVLGPDTTAPVISVVSGTDTVGQGATWTDAGATADTGEIVTASGTVDTNIVGTYAITYTATDAAGNAGTATRAVTVVTNLTFTLNGSGTEYIVSDCLTSASGSLDIPSTYNGLPVTSIGSDAFSDCSALVSITIPDSVTSIPLTAFENSGLTSLSFSSPLLEAAEAERDAKLTLDQVSDLRAGSTMIEIEDGKATLSMEVEQSDDLGIWTTGGSSTLQITIDAAAGDKFFRFKMRE